MNGENRQRRPASRAALIAHPSSLTLAFFSGALAVLGFAPFHIAVAPFACLALLFWQWSRAASAKAAFKIGWVFGLGFFLAGVSWIYVSLNTFGAMPMPLAALATFLFCAFLALFPALAGWGVARCGGTVLTRLLLSAPALWVLAEWLRSWIFTGFPWNSIGYSQIAASPLAGFAPVLGIYGVSLAVTLIAGGIAFIALHWRLAQSVHGVSAALIVSLAAAGYALQHIAWTTPTGAAATVSLLQGNVEQDMKWREDQLHATLNTYADLVMQSRAQLIVLPETALPLFLHQVPPQYLQALAEHAKKNNGDVLIGVPEIQGDPREGRYYNSVASVGSAPMQYYRKSHLVPFGEFIPLRPLLAWIVNILAIPLQDFSRGGIDQQPLSVAGQRVAVNICYEDVFGAEIIRQLPQATMLVNVSNVAWFGRSIAPAQHLQISQARALETGRYMLRATNTGMTAVIDQRGRVLKAAPQFTQAVVEHEVPGYQGTTPYVRWGNSVALALLALMLLAALRAPFAKVWQRGTNSENS